VEKQFNFCLWKAIEPLRSDRAFEAIRASEARISSDSEVSVGSKPSCRF
ncbi:hypothetical protein A2U01_0103798, partial [Trifolium medium]|nr:hypothetical protein [Trifolium medium]